MWPQADSVELDFRCRESVWALRASRVLMTTDKDLVGYGASRAVRDNNGVEMI